MVEVKKTTIWLRKKDAEKPIDGRIKNQGVIMIENKIILIEDDKEIRGMINDYLSGEFEVTAFNDGMSAIQKITSYDEYALALIDLMLPDISGMEIIKIIRKVSKIPIIIITAKDNDIDKSLGLNLGADDYVVKPFSLIELTARIKANIRRARTYQALPNNSIIKIKDIEIDPHSHMVQRKGVTIDLTPIEFQILYILASHPGQAYSKERLYELIWKEPYFGNSEMLSNITNTYSASENVHAMAVKIDQKADDLISTINDYFTMSKITSGDFSIKMKKENISRICQDTILDYYDLLEQKQFEVNIQIPDTPIFAYTDNEALQRILKNLIDNAIRHGGDGKYISLRLTTSNGKNIIEIEDRGDGISPQQQKQIFERNYTTARKTSGSGLGLSISKCLAEQIGADLEVYSVQNEQTIFSIILKKLENR